MEFDLYTYFTLISQFLILLPSALLCYLPMKNMLRFSRMRTLTFCLSVFVPYVLLAALLCLVTKLDVNIILLPSFVLFFILYKRTVRANLPCSLSVFMGVCTLMTFPGQFSYGFDAWLYPQSNAADFSVWGALFQLGISCLFAIALSVPCFRAYSRIVERLTYSSVWYPILAVYGILFLFNMLMIPHYYENLYTGRIFSIFLAIEIIMLLLFLFLHAIFYHIADVVLQHAELTERSRLLEIQAEQYRRLQSYMDHTRRLRHDFRQSVHILSTLAEKGDLPGLMAYLREYEQRWDTDTPVSYCENSALNALFNYYKGMSKSQGIKTDWSISLPEPLTISELDLASLFGNLMENAVAGCMTLPEGKRRFALSVEARQGNCLYVVSTNSFDGHTKKNTDGYLSTKHGGEGMGLLSISSIAKKYHGYARVTDKGEEFFVDIMIKI